MLEAKGATTKSDVYSYGIILQFFITGQKVPFPEHDKGDVVAFFQAVLAGTRPELPAKKAQCPSSLRRLCETCWDAAPDKRPTFVNIISEFSRNVLVDCAIFDGKGRKFWKRCFVKGDELRDEVGWSDFVELFCEHFSAESTPYRPTDAAYKCLRELFCVADLVQLRHFGRMLGFFGPLEKADWIRNVMAVFREPWFWGDTNREVACQKLASENRGTFLIRYASEDSYFTISYVASNPTGKSESCTRARVRLYLYLCCIHTPLTLATRQRRSSTRAFCTTTPATTFSFPRPATAAALARRCRKWCLRSRRRDPTKASSASPV